jgi:hypothetical protein
MTSLRKIEANRRNARKSTGPITEEGKSARAATPSDTGSQPNGDRCAGGAEDYRAFEATIIADYDAQSAVERCG